jgi:uncharacterized protein
MTLEYRSAPGAFPAAAGRTLTGLVTPFDTWTTIGSLDRGGFHERIAPGAFAATLRDRDVVLLHDHDTALVLARSSIPDGEGSLYLFEDPSSGLRMQAIPLQTHTGQDVLRMAARKALRGMSFGFEVVRDSWTDDKGLASNPVYGTRRTIREVRLHEVTTTAFPAYPTTKLAAA